MKNTYKRYIVGIFMILSQYMVFTQFGKVLGLHDDFQMVVSFAFIFLYLKENIYSFDTCLIWEELKKQIKCTCEYLVLVGILILVFKGPKELWKYELLGVVGFCYSFVISKLIRFFLYDFLKENVIIVGVGDTAKELQEVISQNRFTMYNLIGFVETTLEIEKKIKDEEIVGTKERLINIIESKKIDEVIIAIPAMRDVDLHDLIDLVVDKVKKVKIIPEVNRIFTVSPVVQNYDTLMMISNKNYVTSRKRQILKRGIDFFIGLVGCLTLIPLTMIVWLKTDKEERKNGIFFTQNRIGTKGESIRIYKYRSMVTGADEILKKLLEVDKEKRDEYKKNKKLKDDPRITSIGHILRKTSLDEFPQFINVIKGEMSFVGPRPYLFNEIEDMGKSYGKIINLKPGITGMWQAHGRSETNFNERLVLDEYYYRNWSLWLDVVIVIKTVKNVVGRRGAC